MIIRKVWENKGSNQLLISIPKGSDIKVGDYVAVEKIKKGVGNVRKTNR